MTPYCAKQHDAVIRRSPDVPIRGIISKLLTFLELQCGRKIALEHQNVLGIFLLSLRETCFSMPKIVASGLLRYQSLLGVHRLTGRIHKWPSYCTIYVYLVRNFATTYIWQSAARTSQTGDAGHSIKLKCEFNMPPHFTLYWQKPILVIVTYMISGI